MEQLSFDDLEIWKPVPEYVGLYEASSLGRVRSVDRIERITGPKSGIRRRRGRILQQFPMRGVPYLYVRLSKDGRAVTVAVHAVVLTTFDRARPPGLETRHLNGQCHDNRADNLAWGTKSENTLDQVRHGTHHNSRKTTCPEGHEYDYISPAGNHRQCKTCQQRRARQAA